MTPADIAFNSRRQSDTPSGVGNLRRRSGVRPTRCRPSRLCELSWYEVSEPAKHLSLSPNLAVVAYLDNAKLDLVVMPPPPRVSWQLVAAHYLVTKEAGHCLPCPPSARLPAFAYQTWEEQVHGHHLLEHDGGEPRSRTWQSKLPSC